ncbi:hypothetical protein Droror1_Dr00001835 [Drosera rotundifolia]
MMRGLNYLQLTSCLHNVSKHPKPHEACEAPITGVSMVVTMAKELIHLQIRERRKLHSPTNHITEEKRRMSCLAVSFQWEQESRPENAEQRLMCNRIMLFDCLIDINSLH